MSAVGELFAKIREGLRVPFAYLPTIYMTLLLPALKLRLPSKVKVHIDFWIL